MALLTLIVLGGIGAVALWLLRENRHRWEESDTQAPSRDDETRHD